MKATNNIAERKGHELVRTPESTLVKSIGGPSAILRDEQIVLQPDVLERFEHILRLSHQRDPGYLGELEKVNKESPDLYRRYLLSGRRIPELKAYTRVRVSSVDDLPRSSISRPRLATRDDPTKNEAEFIQHPDPN